MKILMMADFFYPHIGGVEKHVKFISKELLKRGYEITVLTRRYSKDLPNQEEYEGINIIRFNDDTILSKYNWLEKNQEIIQQHDIIHFHDFGAFIYWYLPFFKDNLEKPIFVTFHGYEGFPINETAIYMRRVCEKMTYGSIAIGEYINKWYGTKSDFISYGGVETIQGDVLGDKENLTASFVGRLEEDTGIRRYIEAVKILKDKYNKNLKLFICGDGTLRKEIENYVKENELNVTCYGFKDNPQNYVENCEYAFTSGYLSMLESMNNKQFVISIYENELKKDYLGCFPNQTNMFEVCKSADEIADKLNYFDENLNAKNEKIETAYKFSCKQSWGNITDIYEKLYNN